MYKKDEALYIALFLVDLAKFQRSYSCHFAEHGNEMAGIRESGTGCDFLNFHVLMNQEKFFCLIDTVGSDIFVNRTTQEPAEQAG